MLGQPVRFLLVGAAGFAVNLVVFEGLHRAGMPYVAAAMVSYLVSNAFMYLGNRYFTFRLGHDGFLTAYARYMGVGLIVVALNALVLAALVEGTGVDETFGNALALLIVMPVAFWLFKRWTFRLRPA